MFKFFYDKEDPINRFSILLALVSMMAVLIGALLLLGPAKSALTKLIKNAPKKVRLIVIEPENCKDCFDISEITNFAQEVYGFKYSQIKKYEASDPNADLLIKTYEIKVLPTFILQGELKELQLENMFSAQNTTKMEDNLFVYNNSFPPYYDVASETIKGRFNVVYLTDSSCAECYDVYSHDRALENLVMRPSTSSTIDVASSAGKDYVAKYSIKYAPTILLKGDLDTYQNFEKLWETVGTVEDDGMHVFREKGLDLMGKYEDLKTGAILGKKAE